MGRRHHQQTRYTILVQKDKSFDPKDIVTMLDSFANDSVITDTLFGNRPYLTPEVDSIVVSTL